MVMFPQWIKEAFVIFFKGPLAKFLDPNIWPYIHHGSCFWEPGVNVQNNRWDL